MTCTKEKFTELYKTLREDDSWDFKRQIEISKKSEKFNLIKDFIAFSNYGGGHILIGIDKDNKTIVNVENELDPSTIAEIIEKNSGVDIKFELSYFLFESETEESRVGIIYIYPSKEILFSTKDLMSEDGKTIILRANDVYTRRNTRSIKATPKEIEEIIYRIKVKQATEGEISEDKYPVYNSSIQLAKYLGNLIDNKHEINAETFSINLRGLLWFSSFSKKDFAKVCGITLHELENLLLGKEIPSLDFLMRVSKITSVPLQIFFEPNYFGRKAFWTDHDLEFVLMKLVKPSYHLHNIKDSHKFFGKVVYQTANAISELDEFIHSDNTIGGFSVIENKKLKGELTHQHYKLLEQVPENYQFRGLTKAEEIIISWFGCNSKYLCRIFVESIKEIKVKLNDEPSTNFHFTNEINRRKIYGRSYDEKNFKIIFSGQRFPIE